MIIVRNTKVQNNESNNVSIEEIEQIEQKISSVYLWREITEEALPTFDNINNANDKWIWEVVKNNLEKIAPSRYKSYKNFVEEALKYKEKLSKEGNKKETTTKTIDKSQKKIEIAKLGIKKREKSRRFNKQNLVYEHMEDEEHE